MFRHHVRLDIIALIPQYQNLSSALCFEALQFMFFVSTDRTYQYRYIVYSNENIWPSVDLGAGWIILTPTGWNVNRTIGTARCETDIDNTYIHTMEYVCMYCLPFDLKIKN
jgi:hypothetical protein